jgi:hypothetical protein
MLRSQIVRQQRFYGHGLERVRREQTTTAIQLFFVRIEDVDVSADAAGRCRRISRTGVSEIDERISEADVGVAGLINIRYERRPSDDDIAVPGFKSTDGDCRFRRTERSASTAPSKKNA